MKHRLIAALMMGVVLQFAFVQDSFSRRPKLGEIVDGVMSPSFPRDVEPVLKTPGACPQHYPLGVPAMADPKRMTRSFWLCEAAYAVQYDPATKTPVWVAEVLSADNLRNSHEARTENFRENPRLPLPAQGTLKDYRGSGYDRGHMAPAADMGTEETMSASFFLTNMVPQVGPNMNRGIWADLERKIRQQALKRGLVYVMTGPIYSGGAAKELIGPSRVAVPTHLYKIVVDPNEKWAMGFIMPNEEIITKKSRQQSEKAIRCSGTTGQERPCMVEDFIVDVREIQNITGVNLFPNANLNEYRMVSKPPLP